MEPNKSASRYILTALAIILVITAFVLIGLNAFNLEQRLGLSKGKASDEQLAARYKAGYLAARADLKTICPIIERHGDTISGKVTAVSGSKITFTQDSFDTNETIDGVKNDRTANLQTGAKIEVLNPKPVDSFNAEIAAFKPGPNLNPPLPYTVTAGGLGDIKPGVRITLTGSGDLRLAKEFTALTVRIQK